MADHRLRGADSRRLRHLIDARQIAKAVFTRHHSAMRIVSLVVLVWTGAAIAQPVEDPPANAEQTVFSGTAEIVDGDTLKMDGTSIRLFGIDAPEISDWPWGPRARSALEDLTDGQTVTCLQRDIDRDGRAVATCATAETPDLAEALIAAGHAITNHRLTDGTELHRPYLAAERDAQGAGIGPANLAGSEPTWLRLVDRFQSGIGALIGASVGLIAILVGALFNASLTRRRDNRIREEETRALAAELAPEFSAAAARIAIMVKALRNLTSDVPSDVIRLHLDSVPIPNFEIFRSSYGRLGLLGFKHAGTATHLVQTMEMNWAAITIQHDDKKAINRHADELWNLSLMFQDFGRALRIRAGTDQQYSPIDPGGSDAPIDGGPGPDDIIKHYFGTTRSVIRPPSDVSQADQEPDAAKR